MHSFAQRRHKPSGKASAKATKGLVLDQGCSYDLMEWFFDPFLFCGQLRALRRRTVTLARLQPGEQVLDVGCSIRFSLVVIWLFGREYSDRTAKDLLALPTPRAAMVTAKLLVAMCWCAILALWIYLLGLALGALLSLPGWTTDVWLHATAVYSATASLTIALTLPLAWAASAGRGYLPAIGVTVLLFFLAQVLSALGLGPWFPWAAPALLSGAAGPEAQQLGVGTYLLVVAVVAGGITGVIAWWRAADQI